MENITEKTIEAFVERGIYGSKEEVIKEALKALVKQQRRVEAEKDSEQLFEDCVYEQQIKKAFEPEDEIEDLF